MKETNITVYTPESFIRHPMRMLHDMFRDLFAGRELAWQLAMRDIRAQYRQAALGVLWAFILPLAHTMTWIFLSSSGIVTVRSTALPYPVYVITGTMLWAIFMDAINAPLQQVNAGKQMLAKINFPREALILSGVYQTIFNAAFKIILLIAVLQVFGIRPSWSLLLFPIGILSLILAGTAVGLLFTPIGVLYTDIGKALPLLMQFLMYLTPVVFPMPKGPFGSLIFKLNPITPLILTSRDWLTGITPDNLDYFCLISVLSVVILFVVWVVYRAAIPILIERMSA